MSIPVITLTSSSKTGISNPPDIAKNVREASFSSYLDGAEEAFVLKLGARTQGLGPSISTPHDHILRTDDKEIDVFDAQKYFNEGLLNHSPKASSKNSSSHHHKKDDPIKEQPSAAPLSIHSESSCNSGSALLHNGSRNRQPRKANKKSFLATIGCNCSCADNNSTDINECIGENSSSKSISPGVLNGKSRKGDKDKTSGHHLVRKFDEPEVRVNSDGHFSFPVFSSKKDDSSKRTSLEALSMEKKITMMTWDALSPAEEIKIPSISSEMHNDSDSDASSDLFEIESLSKGNPFLSRQGSDGLSSCRTPTNYAPSEASIEWSVITASAADFSLFSDTEELTSKITIPCPKKVGINSKIGSFREIPKLRQSILPGCKSQKAVRVVGGAHRPIEHEISTARKSFTPMTRFHDETRVDAKSRQNLLYT